MLEKQNFLPVGPWIRAEMSYKGTGLGGTLIDRQGTSHARRLRPKGLCPFAQANFLNK